MQNPRRKCFYAFLAVTLLYLIFCSIGLQLDPDPPNAQQQLENKEWVNSSRSWTNRLLCRWFGLCGLTHLNRKSWVWDGDDQLPPVLPDTSAWWTSSPEDPDEWSDEERALREIPQYVLDHAPYVHLFSGEQFWPGDLAEHLTHTTPWVNYTEITDLEGERNLTNLYELNDYSGGKHGRYMYLHSDDNVEEKPDWLTGIKNIPSLPDLDVHTWPVYDHEAPLDPAQVDESIMNTSNDFHTLVASTNGRCGGNSGFTCQGSKFGKCCSIYGWCGRGDAYCGDPCDPKAGECRNPFEPVPKPHMDLRKRSEPALPAEKKQFGKSPAPAILVVVPKKDGIVDAFWFFFYSYNLGQKVVFRFGNHVGDWEHTLIRFKDGKPESAFLSEHSFGDAYAWHALEKYLPSEDGSGTMIGSWSNATAGLSAKRPVVYSAVGTHAMYATPGLHPYILPYGILHDQTDRGPLWDPSLNVRAFTYDPSTHVARASTLNPKAPTGWFHYAGHWGDKHYPLSDKRQYRFAGQYHYVNGPTGPKFKNLAREKVCPYYRACRIRHWASEGASRWRTPAEEMAEVGGLPGGNWTDDFVGGPGVRVG